MPYLRAAYEWDWSDQAVHVGALYMQSNVNPVSGVFQTDGSNGRDHYRDYAFDAGYQFLGDHTHIVTAQGIFTHEARNLEARRRRSIPRTARRWHRSRASIRSG